MTKFSLKKLIICICIFLAGLFLAQIIYHAKVNIDKKNNHDNVLKLINEDLTLSKDTLPEEVEVINTMITDGHYSDGDLGRLYERAGLMYMQMGEEMTYYRYLGYALYYLEASGERDYAVNIYLDLANFHLNNYAYSSAEEMVKQAKEIEPFVSIKDPQVKSYAYRILALIEIEKENYDVAEEYLIRSQKLVNSNETGYSIAYTMFNEAALARVYVYQGRLDEAQAILDKYKDSDAFTSEDYKQILLRDFVIPYYQAEFLLKVARNFENPETLSKANTEEFIKLCMDNGYDKTALSTLITLQEKYPTDNTDIQQAIANDITMLNSKIFENQNKSYSTLINSQVNDSKVAMARGNQITDITKKRTTLTGVSIVITAFIILFFVMIILNSRRDGLTFLYNRKTFNADIDRLKRSMVPYSVIMMDIDNFKNINDTYGHPEGDKVLQKLGQLINNEVSPDIKGYRYGGEEFAIVCTKASTENTLELAEKLRLGMEAARWTFDPELIITISAGISSGSGPVDVVKFADDNLYYSKQHGKNQIYTN